MIFLFVDIVIIIGIFVLQFRTDSSIIEKFGRLQLSLESSDTEANITTLSNKLQVTYNGLNFHSDERNCAYIEYKDNTTKKVQIKDWTKLNNLHFTIHFTEDVALSFELSDADNSATLSIISELPENVTALYIPFNYTFNMQLKSNENGKLVLNDKKTSWDFSVPEISEGFLKFSKKNSLARYSIHSDKKKFSFSDITEIAASTTEVYSNSIYDLCENLVNSVKATFSEPTLSEQAVVSYIAVMAKNGKFQQALDDIPQNFKRGNQRTYLSAPYLNNLTETSKSLDADIKEKESLISRSSNYENLDIFTTKNLGFYMTISKNTVAVKNILGKAASAQIEGCSLAQISGIILTYCDLCELMPEYAVILQPVIEKCIERVTDACSFENNVLVISENGTFLSVLQAVETGTAILRYGRLASDETLVKGGRVIINSYISESSAFDARTLSALYSLLAFDNYFYPHFTLINKTNDNTIWAWTCAKEITYKSVGKLSSEFTIDFTKDLTHYVIFKGIQKFDTIYIYNIPFRTDPRFETYNSSGYVYQASTETLLIKSRHKNQFEDIKLETAAKHPQPAVEPATPDANNTTPETSGETKPEEEKAASTTEQSETPVTSNITSEQQAEYARLRALAQEAEQRRLEEQQKQLH